MRNGFWAQLHLTLRRELMQRFYITETELYKKKYRILVPKELTNADLILTDRPVLDSPTPEGWKAELT